ncbi:MAG: beta-lactamase family protein [Gammaproteobacteria bacterium]|nr:beta-lactamase family protein [Gammaproteobacteria bacterium]MBT4492713.1 beta-lactamase family protein [Gammaproteobacteria bacterium]MBT7370078.1 beta-lactamase family protein [Gammaproteobacteria bacterium]
MLLRYLFIFLLLFPLISLGSDFASEFESRYVNPLVKQTPGGALVIVENGRVALEKTYGVLEAEGESPVTGNTLFRIASLSKTFASAAASLLVRETALTWQTPLRAELSSLRFKSSEYGEKINLWHIMSQSSGLMPHAYTNLIEENMSYARIVDRLHRVDFVCPPGRCYGYQNVVFSLVGNLVESQTSLGYPEYVDRKLFGPLGMQRASFGHESFIRDVDHAKPHVWTGSRWRPIKPTSHYYKVPPAAGVNASITDLRQWLLAQLGQNPDILEREILDEMHRGVIRTSRQQAHYPYRKKLGEVYYGLGWRVFDYGQEKGYVHHGGYIRGMTSTMVFHRPTRTGVVFLTNSEPRGINNLVLDFADLHARLQTSQSSSFAAR